MSRHVGCFAVSSAILVAMVLGIGTNVMAVDDVKGAGDAAKAEALEKDVTQGALRLVLKDGKVVECPLKHTDVHADVSGFIARVNVIQTFQNPTDEMIEAVYVFPLPHKAAVDNMTMVIGQRKIVGVIKRRAEARQIYEQALMQGQTAALLEQERPNIFTQSVGNIEPNQEVRIEISYVDVLKYDIQEYEFYFPMVVGPRFMPGQSSGLTNPTPQELQGKVSPPVANTTRVPDAERISPPVLKPGFRNGHDIRVTLTIDAGVPIENVAVANHEADVQRDGTSRAVIELSPADSVPNKDFVVRYDVAGEEPELALLTHTGEYSKDVTRLGNGYFMLMMQPKEDERLKKSPPREIVFLVDVSGSMRGAKTAKAVDAMKQMLGLCREIDTVQVITFASRADKLFEKPLPVNQASIGRALNFADQIRGSGGTHMLQGVKLAIDEPIDPQRVRIVVMLTDGFIGNEAEIIEHVGKECGDHVRFWAVGVGQSPNMFLIDGVARQGGGMGKRLGLNDETEILATEAMTRIQRAQMANIKIDWGDAKIVETYPARIPELWAGRPVVVYGRFSGSGRHQIHVSGTIEGDAQWPLAIDLPNANPKNGVLAKVWARQRIEDLMHQAFYADSPAIEEEVTAIALDYGLMSQYTSFVAVDKSQSEVPLQTARPPRRMLVPVPLPEGAQWEGFFGMGGDKPSEFGLYDSLSLYRAKSEAAPSRSRGLSASRSSRRVVRAGAMPSSGPSPLSPTYAAPMVRLSVNLPTQLSKANYAYSLEQARGQRGLGSSFGRGFGVGGFGGRGGGIDAFSADGLSSGLSEARRISSLFPPVQEYMTLTQSALQTFEKHEKNGDREAARLALVRALFLAQAVVNVGQTDSGIANNCLQQLTDRHKQQVAAWQKSSPKLTQRLDLMLRDQSVVDALQQIARAAKMDIEVVPQSVRDAEQLLGRPARVSYLNLRGATVAEALDWILQPLRLTWRPSDGKIVAGSDCRLPGTSAWVYDVSALTSPTVAELKETESGADYLKAVKEVVDKLLVVVRGKNDPSGVDSVFWFGPGHLLVFGDQQRHAEIRQLLTDLLDVESNNRLEGAAGELQQITHQRVEATRKVIEDRAEARLLSRIAHSHAVFGWRLLASAAKGEVDDEAVTELEIAWQSPATLELLKAEGRPLLLRSLWLVTQATRSMPDDERLADLATLAMRLAKTSLGDACAAVEKSPADLTAFFGLLYATLALPPEDELRADCSNLLMSASKDQPTLQGARTIAESLVQPTARLDGERLKVALGENAAEDILVLAALACRRADSQTWQVYRQTARELLRQSTVAGSVVVLINNMGAASNLAR